MFFVKKFENERMNKDAHSRAFHPVIIDLHGDLDLKYLLFSA
jgi:hypothetical protein